MRRCMWILSLCILMGIVANTQELAEENHTKVAQNQNFIQQILQQDTLTGDWFGLRPKLEDAGISFELVYTGDIFANVAGGIRRKSVYLDNIDLIMSLDTEKLVSWKGGTVYLYVIGNNGGSPSANSGDMQGVNNIEANATWKLYEAWYEQNLLEGRISIKAGLYDLNSEFDVIETAGLFINSSHGIGPDYSQSGINGPSIFPATSLGARIRLEPTSDTYLQLAVFDGVSGDPGQPHGTQVIFKKEDGVLIAVELGILPQKEANNENSLYAKYALGAWYYTGKFDDLLATEANGTPMKRRGNQGFYFLAEQQVYQESQQHSRGLALFGRVGIANAKVNQLYLYTGAGMVYTGIMNRDEDKIGLAVAIAYNGDDFKKAAKKAGETVDDFELNLEFTYLAQLTPWLTIQPNLQYIVNPGMNPHLHDALSLGIRTTVSF